MNEPIIFPKTLTPKELDGLDPSSKIIIKPISGGSSVGVKIKKVKEIKKVINKINYFQNMMEPLVGNRELTVTVLDNKPLTVTEILQKKMKLFTIIVLNILQVAHCIIYQQKFQLKFLN